MGMKKLEIEVQECSHMILNLENLRKPFGINLGTSDATKINIEAIYLKSEKDVTCRPTGKPCVLYFSFSPRINYSHLDRCPSAGNTIRKYRLEGIKKEHIFHVFEIEGVGE